MRDCGVPSLVAEAGPAPGTPDVDTPRREAGPRGLSEVAAAFDLPPPAAAGGAEDGGGENPEGDGVRCAKSHASAL